MKLPFTLANDKKYDVVGFGTNAVDHLIRVKAYPSFDSKTEILGRSVMAGGEVASTLVGLSRLGAATAYIGRFGDDADGELGLRSLVAEDVDVTYSETIAGASTQVGYIIVDETTGERTVMWMREERVRYSPGEVPTQAAALCRILHLTPHDTSAAIKLARLAREAGAVVSLDIDRWFSGTEDLLALTDICIGSKEFLREVTGHDDMRAAVLDLNSKFGCAVSGVTLGSAGALICCQGEVIDAHGVPVAGGCIDTTGAGDAFRTGFLFGVLAGEPLEECCNLANLVASLKCRGIGARSALPTLSELQGWRKST